MGRKKSAKSSRVKQQAFVSLRLIAFYSVSIFLLFLFATHFISSANKELPCANSISCIKDLSGAYDAEVGEGTFLGKTVSLPPQLFVDSQSLAVLGSSNQGKRIEIDLSTQRLFAKEGDATIYEFPISSGKWGQTPTGEFSVWIKLRYTRMKGGSVDLGTYYDLPNVPYTMFFSGGDIPKSRGYGIHGAYWHNNFGHPMSHGCINMKPEDVEKIYYWADPPSTANSVKADKDNPGTKIVIYGTAPLE